MGQIKQKKEQIIMGIVLVIYLLAVLWFTVLNRHVRVKISQYVIFWSYRKWFAGDKEIGMQILANIAMFTPLGFLMASIFYSISFRSHRLINLFIVVAAAALFSTMIEVLQLFLKRGTFEWDDLFSNTIGAVIGFGCYHIIVQWISKPIVQIVNLISGALILVICCIVIFNSGFVEALKQYNTQRGYCFQIDKVVYDISENQVEISGVAFRYKNEAASFSLSLKSTGTGEKIKLTSISRTERPDVNAYFACEHDYTQSGFKATISSTEINLSEEYEVMIRWPLSYEVSTGVYITGNDVHYISEREFSAPDGGSDLQEIVEKGTLRVYRPDFHCWVYQIDSELYWIAGVDFNFEEDNTTYIQYHLWTTQIENLPEKRLAHRNYWDNIGGHFEKYELNGDFGNYRVSKRKLPTAYSITMIKTGYYKNDKWIWKSYFRPIYDF